MIFSLSFWTDVSLHPWTLHRAGPCISAFQKLPAPIMNPVSEVGRRDKYKEKKTTGQGLHGRSCCRLRSELLAGARLLQRLALAAHYPVLWRHTVEGALQH